MMHSWLTSMCVLLTEGLEQQLREAAQVLQRKAERSAARQVEWADGPLVQAMKAGDALLIDEINLAEDAVLERLNRCSLASTRCCPLGCACAQTASYGKMYSACGHAIISSSLQACLGCLMAQECKQSHMLSSTPISVQCAGAGGQLGPG